jgi:hypothetical protein
MDKPKRKKREHDFAVTAFRVYQEAIGEKPPEAEKPPAKPRQFDAKALGHKGGLKGGKARADKLTPKQRQDIARKAAEKRWAKRPPVS